jgi:hypothetical protein
MPNKPIKKKEFDDKVQTQLDEYNSPTKLKPQEYYSCGEEFLTNVGLPGPAKGHINQFIGHSDSGKTAALLLAAADAQRQGDLPVFLITELKWSFEHAQLMGFNCNQNDKGEWKGFFLYNDDFDYVEQVTDYVNGLIDAQEKGKLPYNLAFFWDSVGSIPCKLTFEGGGGRQHTAGVLAEKIGMGLNHRILSTRKDGKKYTNTLTIITQPWVWKDMKNPRIASRLQGKGGNAIYLNSSLVFQFGNIENAGISGIKAAKGGRQIKYATRTKVSIVKNHINGLGFVDGHIIITPHFFIADNQKAIDKYKLEHGDYFRKILEIEGDFDLIEEVVTAETAAAITGQDDDSSED